MINALIIDDEPLAHKVLENYAKDIPYLEIVGNAYDALNAGEILQKNTIDLLFLDIHLPKIKGLAFLRTIANPPLVIITSAYDQYALEGYELNICDYLLKPFGFERLLKAVNKVYRMHDKSILKIEPSEKTMPFFIKSGKKHIQVDYQDILYLEAYGSYTKIYFPEEFILASNRISFFEQSLPIGFLRIHKSYIVSLSKIKQLEGRQLTIGKKILPIGNLYKQQIRKIIHPPK